MKLIKIKDKNSSNDGVTLDEKKSASAPVLATTSNPDWEALGVADGGTVNGKPRFIVDSKAVINTHSGFKKKLLCGGPTFTAGQACAFSCTFCYVETMIFKKNQRLQAIAKERGLKFEEMVVEIKDAATKAREFLTKKNGNLRGKTADFDVLMQEIFKKCEKNDYALIILDPVYKLMVGKSENLAGGVGALCRQLERLA
jgi:hypothetical protein